MAYSTISKPSLHFNTLLYSGNGSNTQAITGVGFQPDWIWIKDRDASHDHYSWDAVRTNKKGLEPSDTSAERTPTLGSIDSNGFTFASTDGFYNSNGDNYVSWNWKGNGSGSANTDGDINSTVSANQTSGFSIVKYQGNGSNDQRVGHGLGTRPAGWFIKRLDSADDWIVYHQGLAANWYDDTYLYLNSTSQVMGAINAGTGNPTSSVFYIGDTGRTGANGDNYIAYVFAEKKGFSKFGKYTGNNSAQGPFVYTGFKPAWVMIKRKDGTDTWRMYDNKRLGRNPDNNPLFANAGTTESTDDDLDFLSNGFKVRRASGSINSSGAHNIYIAFAEQPLVANVGTSGIPATAK